MLINCSFYCVFLFAVTIKLDMMLHQNFGAEETKFGFIASIEKFTDP